MLKVTIHWSKDIPVDSLKTYKERNNEHLYIVLRKHTFSPFRRYRPMYLGMAYRQSVIRRLKSHHKLKDIIKQQFGLGKIVVRIGQIDLPKKYRISQDLVDDIESVLIINEQTRYNTVSRKNTEVAALKLSTGGNIAHSTEKLIQLILSKNAQYLDSACCLFWYWLLPSFIFHLQIRVIVSSFVGQITQWGKWRIGGILLLLSSFELLHLAV